MLFNTLPTLTNAFIFTVSMLSLIPAANADAYGNIVEFSYPDATEIIAADDWLTVKWYVPSGEIER
jgi:hypothetical protein